MGWRVGEPERLAMTGTSETLMRIRSVKPEFFTDRVTARWPRDQKLVYIALWVWADDDGRFEWEPELFRAQLFPLDHELNVIENWEAIVTSGQVEKYQGTDGLWYGSIRAFKAHQHPKKPTRSSKPPPPDRQASLLMPELVEEEFPTGGEGYLAGGEGRGEEGRGVESSSEPQGSSEQAVPSLPAFPCVGEEAGPFYVTPSLLDGWVKAYPGVDVMGEVHRASAWLAANPSRRKTYRGMPRFLVSWLSRAQDRARSGGAAPGGGTIGALAAKSRWGSR